MVTSRGRDEVKRFIAQIPGQIETKLLRGAARAGIGVVKQEASDRVTSDTVRESLTIKAPSPTPGRVEAKLTVKGRWPSSLAIWLEYGTDPHVIRASDAARGGRSVTRFSRQVREGALVIGGRFVGEVVNHPGAQQKPFLRVSLDLKAAEAVAAAQAYITAHVRPTGITADDTADENAEA